MKVIVFLFPVVLFMFSCAQESSSDEDFSTYYPQSFSSIEQELKNTDFFCEDASDCPDNVGLVYINTNGSDFSPQIGRCTGFLVDDDIVGTNSHCIPDHLRGGKNNCSGQLAIRFLNKGKTNVFNCEELLDHSPLGVYDPDYAFFKIKSTGIKPFSISQKGVKDNQNISVARVTPSHNSLGGTLSVDSCRVALGSLLNLKATNSWAETSLAVDCEAIPGNSGSPVLNSGGEVIGILQSKMRDQFLVNLEHNFKQFGLDLPSQIKPHFIFTNFSCIESEGILKKQKKCEDGKKMSFSDCLVLDKEENEKRGARVIDVWKKELPDIFIYKFITKVKDGSVNAEPLCVKSKDQSSSYESYVEKKGVLGFRKDSLDLKYSRVMSLGAKFDIDANLRLMPTLEFNEKQRLEYQLNLKRTSNKWDGTTNSTHRSRLADLTKIKIPMTVSECSSDQIKKGDLSLVQLVDKSLLTESEYIAKEKHDKKLKIKCER